MKKVLIIGTVLIAGIGLLALYLLSVGRIRMNYPDRDEFPIMGIDISHHQLEIRWDELRTEAISFAIIKATEGGDYKDPLFKKNWTNSKRIGLKTGAYHFYRICKNGKEQAQNFINTVPNERDNLPPTIDLEFGGNCNTNKSDEQIMSEIKECLEVLEDHYHRKPIIYVTEEFYEHYLVGHLEGYPIWIRDIYGRPKLHDNRDWLIWQFTNRGHLNGIDTYVDLNVLNGKSLEILMQKR